MNFILRMAWRDSRASRRRLALVSLSVVLGIAALVGIGSFADNLKRTVELQTKALLGSDLTIAARQKFPDEAEAAFRALGAERAEEISLGSMVSFPTRGDQRRLVQVRALEGNFPFYGEAVTTPPGAMALVQAGQGALLEETLLVQFGVQAGDEVRIGRETFKVVGALRKMPGESAAVAMFSPRVYVSRAALEATGLLASKTFITHREHFRLPAKTDPEQVVKDLKAKFAKQRWQYATVEERKRDLGQTLKDTYSFISLVGFVALFLGAVGVASAMHVYVRQKLNTVAVLRCLGASTRTSFAVYLIQGLGVGLLGAVLGAALGVLVQLVLPVVVKDFLPFSVDFYVSWPAVGKGALAGLVICVLFTLLPLLAVRRVSPLLAIRSAQGEAAGRDPLQAALIATIAVAILAFAVWQTGHWLTGLGFALMMALGFGTLAGMAQLVSWLARRFVPRRPLPYVARQGLANLHRPNNRTVLLLLSLGLGTFLMLTLVLTRQTLVNKILGIGEGARPNLMFFDIQDDQAARLGAIVKEQGALLVAEAPVVTMRLANVRGRTADEILKDEKSGIPAWTLRREYRSTFRGELANTEKVTEGKFVGRVEPGAARVPVSVEAGLAKELQLKLGDDLGFDVQGVPVKAYVASLREVEWQRMQPNFFIVFPEGVLEPAPKTHIAAVRAAGPAESAQVQRAVAKEFPTVSAIDLALILQTFMGIMEKVSAVITFMAAFTVVTGVIVLAGAVLTGRFQRLRETVLLRTLGATRRQLRQIQLIEYAVLGVLAAVAGGGLAVLANALLSRFVFKTAFVLSPVVLLVAVVASVIVTLVTGLVANRGIVDHPPLEVLRQET
ncbi:MAG TPA: FtsX-like permease family protein [Opitutaceae bacterium]|nr:FtsX-like permease family protein [Opitutaceae bacterium]HND59995.1 FtsX-like permease family protein [Opitutaceae bacterium]